MKLASYKDNSNNQTNTNGNISEEEYNNLIDVYFNDIYPNKFKKIFNRKNIEGSIEVNISYNDINNNKNSTNFTFLDEILSNEVYSKECEINSDYSKNNVIINILIIILLYVVILSLTIFIYKKYNKIIVEYRSLKSKLKNKFKNNRINTNISSIDGISVQRNNSNESDNDSDSDPDSLRGNNVNNYIFDRPIKNF